MQEANNTTNKFNVAVFEQGYLIFGKSEKFQMQCLHGKVSNGCHFLKHRSAVNRVKRKAVKVSYHLVFGIFFGGNIDWHTDLGEKLSSKFSHSALAIPFFNLEQIITSSARNSCFEKGERLTYGF